MNEYAWAKKRCILETGKENVRESKIDLIEQSDSEG